MNIEASHGNIRDSHPKAGLILPIDLSWYDESFSRTADDRHAWLSEMWRDTIG